MPNVPKRPDPTGDLQDHIDSFNNPHNVTPRQVGGISAWQPSTGYQLGDFVFYDQSSTLGDTAFGNGIYLCVTPHTSHSSNFYNDQSNWKIMNSSYQHNQSTPSSNWQVDHQLGRFPVVMVTSSTDNMIDGQIEHSSVNRLFVRFNSAITGKVYCT